MYVSFSCCFFLSSHVSFTVPVPPLPCFCGEVGWIQNLTFDLVFHISGKCNCQEIFHLLLFTQVLGLRKRE